MAYEIIYKCNSTNNKNVREGELNILRAYPDKLYFEFGENEMNVKKRFYNDVETMNTDFEALEKIAEGFKNLGVSAEEIGKGLEKAVEPLKSCANEEEPVAKKVEEEPIKYNKRKRKFNQKIIEKT